MEVKVEEIRRGEKLTGTVFTFTHDGKAIELTAHDDIAHSLFDEIEKRCNAFDALIVALIEARYTLVSVNDEYRPEGQIKDELSKAYDEITNTLRCLNADPECDDEESP